MHANVPTNTSHADIFIDEAEHSITKDPVFFLQVSPYVDRNENLILEINPLPTYSVLFIHKVILYHLSFTL